MKVNKYFSTTVFDVGIIPRQKLLDPLIGASVIKSGLGFVSSLFSNKSNSDINQQNIDFQREENEKNRDFSREQMSWQEALNDKNNAFNRAMAQEQFDREAAYNDPLALKQRLQRAGINTQLAFSNGVSGMMGSPDAAAAVAGGSGVSNPSYQGIAPHAEFTSERNPNSISAISSIADVLEKLSNSDLNRAKKNEINSTLSVRLDNIIADTENKEAATQLENLKYSIEKGFGPLMAHANLEKAWADVENVLEDTALKVSNGELVDEKIQSEQVERDLNRMLKKLKGEEYRLAKQRADTFMQSFRQELRESNSRINANNSSAEYSHENAVSVRSLRPYNVSKASWDAVLTKWSAITKRDSSKFEVGKSAADMLYKAAELAYKDKELSWYDFIQIKNSILETVDRGVSILHEVNPLKP